MTTAPTQKTVDGFPGPDETLRAVGARLTAAGATHFVEISPATVAKMRRYIRTKGGRMFDAGEPKFIRCYNNDGTPEETFDAITVFHTRGVPLGPVRRPGDPRVVYEYGLWTAAGAYCTGDTLSHPPPGGWGGKPWPACGRQVKWSTLPAPVREQTILDYCFNHFAPERADWNQWEDNGIGEQFAGVFKRLMDEAAQSFKG